MTCTLTMDVTGITTAGVLTSIVVTGTATNCNSVTVLIQCGTGQQQIQTNVAVDTSTTPPTWTVTFQPVPESCVCTKLIRAVARCDDHMESCQTTFSGALKCMPEGGGEVCPTIDLIEITPGDFCNSDGTRAIQLTFQLDGSNYSANLVDASGMILDSLMGVSGTHNLSGGGNYAGTETFSVIVTSPTGCPKKSVDVHISACLPCPEITFETPIVTPSSSGQNTVTVTATLHPSSLSQSYAAELRDAGTTLFTLPSGFGDRSMSASESVPDGSSRTYDAVITSPLGCSPAHVVAHTPGGGGGGGGESGGCFGARVIMTVAAILAIVSIALAICVPPAATVLLWIALGLGIAATLAAIYWAIFCTKPCAWGLLLSWQVSIGVGFVLLYFTTCCPNFWYIGLPLIAAGVAAMFAWKRHCNMSRCAVLKELSIALSSVILPLLGWLGVIPALAACINHVVAGILSTLAAVVGAAVLHCVSSLQTTSESTQPGQPLTDLRHPDSQI